MPSGTVKVVPHLLGDSQLKHPRRMHWMGRIVITIPGASYHSSGEATVPRALSRRDGLVHLQRPGIIMGLFRCGLRYNLYRRIGMRGFKAIPTDAPVTCMVCIVKEADES